MTMPLFLHWVAVAFSGCPLFFPTMARFAFDIVIPFSLSETLISYQATCSENKSSLRGHYVNREYKPDVSPKIYKQLWGSTDQIEEVLKCFSIANIQRVFYILAPHCGICVNQQGSQLFREQSGTGGEDIGLDLYYVHSLSITLYLLLDFVFSTLASRIGGKFAKYIICG